MHPAPSGGKTPIEDSREALSENFAAGRESVGFELLKSFRGLIGKGCRVRRFHHLDIISNSSSPPSDRRLQWASLRLVPFRVFRNCFCCNDFPFHQLAPVPLAICSTETSTLSSQVSLIKDRWIRHFEARKERVRRTSQKCSRSTAENTHHVPVTCLPENEGGRSA